MNKIISAFGGKKIVSIAMASAMAFMVAAPALAITGFTSAQVAPHNTAANCWMIISGKVYNVTSFIPIHPGGNQMVPLCGMDATSAFNSIHSATALALLPNYYIGDLMTALSAPTNLVGTPSQTSVALSWSASAGGIAPLTYSIMRNGVSVGTVSALSFTDTGLAASTTYSYVIKVTDNATPTANTASSAAVSVTTLAVSVPGPLTAPTNLAGTPSLTSVALTWNASTGGTAPISYSVLRNGIAVGTTSAVSFTDTGLASSTAYSYVVKATDSATPTPATATSAALSVTTLSSTPSPDRTRPTVSITAPANKATVTGIVTITVNAADNVGVTKVILYVDGRQAAVSTSSPFSFTWDSSKVTRKSHTIRVRAFDAAGNSRLSKTIKVKVQNTIPKPRHEDGENEHGQSGNSQNHERNDD